MRLLGVYDDYLVEPLAQVLINLGIKRGMVVVVWAGRAGLTRISMECTDYDLRDSWRLVQILGDYSRRFWL